MKFQTVYYDEFDNEVDIYVYFDYYAGCKGARDSLGGKRGAGPPLEPDDEPELEITKVTNKAGGELELDKLTMEKLQEECWDLVYNE